MFKRNDHNDFFVLAFFVILSLVLIYFFAIHAAGAQATEYITISPREINIQESTNDPTIGKYDDLANIRVTLTAAPTEALKVPWSVTGARLEIDQRTRLYITDRDGADTLRIAPGTTDRTMWLIGARDDNFLSGPLTFTIQFEAPPGWKIRGSSTISVTVHDDETAWIYSHRLTDKNIGRCIWERPEDATTTLTDAYGFDLSKPVGFTVQPAYDLYDLSHVPPRKVKSGSLNIQAVGTGRQPGVTNTRSQLVCVNIAGFSGSDLSFEFSSTHSVPEIEKHLKIQNNHFVQGGRTIEVHAPGSSAKAFDLPAEASVVVDPPTDDQQSVGDRVLWIRWLLEQGFTVEELVSIGVLPKENPPEAAIPPPPPTIEMVAAAPSIRAGEDAVFLVYADRKLDTGIDVQVRSDVLPRGAFDTPDSIYTISLAATDSTAQLLIPTAFRRGASGWLNAYFMGHPTARFGAKKYARVQVRGRLLSMSAYAYPNPFNPETAISYTSDGGHVSISIYNIMGQRVRDLVARDHTPGTYRVRWNSMDDGGRRVASGVYFAKITGARGTAHTIKLTLLK